MQHFQFHCLDHIFPLTKPQNQFITFLHTTGSKPYPVIQISQFICPFLSVVPFFQLFQYADTLFQTHILGLIKFVLQNIPAGILWRRLNIFLIIVYGRHKLLGFYAQLTEGVTNRPPSRFPLVCQQQHIFCIFVPSVLLVQIADGTKHHNTFYPPPVYRICNLSRLDIFSLCY